MPEPTPAPTPEPETTVIPELILDSRAPGEITAKWAKPETNPKDYQVTWETAGTVEQPNNFSFGSFGTRSDDQSLSKFTAEALGQPVQQPVNQVVGNAFPNTEQVTIADLEPGQQYTIKVRARFDPPNLDPFNGPWQQGVVIADNDPPAKPTGLAVTLTNGQAVLTWTDPGSDADVTHYRIYRSFSIDHLVTLKTTREKVTTHTDKRPSQGQVNVYAIRAFNDFGQSVLSDAVRITPPEPPDNLSATVTNTGVTLTWEQPEMVSWLTEADMTITGYQILRGTAPNNLTVLNTNTGNATTTYSDTTTRPAGGVHYAVRTRTATGMSLPSATIAVGTPDPVDTFDGNSLTLASNWGLGGRRDTVTIGTEAVSEPFQTGPSSSGYVIETLRLDVSEVTEQPELNVSIVTGQPQLAVSIHEDSNSRPGTKVHDLTGPMSLTAGTVTFTAPDDARLRSNTKYWIVFERTAASTGSVKLWLANLGAGDKFAARGFQLFQQNALYYHPSPIRLAITGQDRADTPADATTRATVKVGRTVRGTIDGYGDRDWFRIWLRANTMYRFDDIAERGNKATVLAIYDANGQRQTVSKFLLDPPKDLRRVYFTPTTSGDYYVSMGVLGRAHINGDNYGEYRLRVIEGDPETENIDTEARVSSNGPYSGNLYTPHAGSTDTDWVQLATTTGVRYQIIAVSDPRVKTSIASIRGPDGQPIPEFKSVTSPARKPLFSVNGETGEHSLTGYQYPGDNDHGSWLETIFEAPLRANHYIEITGEPATYRKGPQLGENGQPLPGAVDTIAQMDFHGADYLFHAWASDQGTTSEQWANGEDAGSADLSTPISINTQGNPAQGHIHHAGDVDWFAVWMKPGHHYAIMLDTKGKDANILGISELPWPSLGLPGHRHNLTRAETGTSNCYIHVLPARREGIHFLAVTGQTTGAYDLSVMEAPPTANHLYTEEHDRGRCAGAGYLRPSQSARGYNSENDSDSHFFRLEGGKTYNVSLHTSYNSRHTTRLVTLGGVATPPDRVTTTNGYTQHWNVTQTRDTYYELRHTIQGRWDNQPYTLTVTPADAPDLPLATISSVENGAAVTTRPEVNEGDDITFRVSLSRAVEHDVTVNFKLTSEPDQFVDYPKYSGGNEQSVTIRRGDTTADIDITVLDDDVHAGAVNTAQAVITPGPQYRIGYSYTAGARITGGSYDAERDMDGLPTNNMVFDESADSVELGWSNCGQPINVQEPAGTVPLTLHVLKGTVAYDYSLAVRFNDGTASKQNDYYDRPDTIHFNAYERHANIHVPIIDHPRVEETEEFDISFFRTDLTEHFEILCTQMTVKIEDHDTAQTRIEAEADTVPEGDNITINFRTPGQEDDYLIPFAVYAEVTPTGDTSALTDPNPQIIYVNAGDVLGTATFATVEDTTVTANRSVTFTVTRIGTAADFSTTHDRVLLPTRGVTVTVEEDDG